MRFQPSRIPAASRESLSATPTGRCQGTAGVGRSRRRISALPQRRLFATSTQSPGADQLQLQTSRMKTMLEGEGSDYDLISSQVNYPCAATGGFDNEQYEEMLRKEARDVNLALQISSRSKGPTSPCMREPKASCRVVDMDEDLPVALAAEMVQAGEEGLTMGSSPEKMFNHLFPDCQDEAFLNVSPASGSPANVVVPLAEEQGIAMGTMMEEAALVASVVTTEPIRPSHSLFNDTIGESSLHIADLWKTKGSMNEESIRSNLADITIGAGQHPPDPRSPGTSLGITRHGLNVTGSEFFLDRALPAHYSLIQLRGTRPPSWFPGFMSALPAHHPDVVVLSSRPSEVLHNAWGTLNPDTFPQDGIKLLGV